MTSAPYRTSWIVLVGFLALMGCDKSSSSGAEDDASDVASTDVGSATRDAALASDSASPDAGSESDETARTPLPGSPLGPARSHDELEDVLPGAAFGSLQGAAFGEESKVYGMIRLNCGSGTVLQPIFRRTPESELEVAPPTPLQFYGLETGRPVTYQEDDFRITVDFDRDDAEKLRGQLTITYDEHGEERTYARLDYDGPPIGSSFPPRMKGDGKLPIFPDCFPSGYFRLETTDGEVVTGLARIIDIDGSGVPFARILVGDRSAFQLMAVPRNRGEILDPAQTVALAEARRTTGELGVLVDVHHRPELIGPHEAIGANLGTLQESKVLEGKATVRVFDKGRDRFFDARFENVRISSIIDGPLSGRAFKEIRLYGKMVKPNELPVELTEPPEWYDSPDRTGDDEPASP